MSGEGRPPLRVEVLGPLRLTVAGRAVDVPGVKRRALLALLALAEGRTVTVDRLVDTLWPGGVPDSGRQALHSLVFRLRGHLGASAARLQTPPEGYRLDLSADELDLSEARALVTAARASADDPERAYGLLRRADELWRGTLLADLLDVEPIAAAVEECAQLRRDVTDAMIGAAVRAGRAPEVARLSTQALAADPLREPAAMLAMQALAATGEPAEALRVGREFRVRLADETGLDTTPALGELERRIAGGAEGTPAPRIVVPTASGAPLVGRDAQVAALHRLLAEQRLVSVVGPGGVGKTRVAWEIARGTDGAALLSLAALTDAAGLPHALASALDLDVVRGDVLSACVAVLAAQPGLLVVDNCEHLLEPARDLVAALVQGCPTLSILTTSREPLGLAAEYVFRLAPLAVPGAEGDPRQAPAVTVFVDRASRVRPDVRVGPAELGLVAGIVRRLDGMPLAIELAAGRLSTLSLADLSERLDRSLDLLGGGRTTVDARHRTLRATVEWSYDLLSPAEQRLFRHLAVFPDGLDLSDAEHVGESLGLAGDVGSILARLVDASMVEVHFRGGTRYRMLYVLRAFGVDRLEAAGETETAERHLLVWAARLVRWLAATMLTEQEPEADRRLRREIANLRAAWRLARRRGALDVAAAIVVEMYEAITYRDLVEIRSWALELSEEPALSGHSRAAAVLGVAGEAAYLAGDQARAEELGRAGLAQAVDAEARWLCRSPLSVVALARGDYTEASAQALAAVAETDQPRENRGLAALAEAYAGRIGRARALVAGQEGTARSPTLRAWAAYVTAEIETADGRRDLAEPFYEEAIGLARESGATFLVGVARVGLVAAWADAGRVADSLQGYREVIDYFERTGNWIHLWVALRNLAVLLRRLGEESVAAMLDAEADRAPDAPPVRTAPASDAVDVASQRARMLAEARAAIERSLRLSARAIRA